jgi:hypothetical protein
LKHLISNFKKFLYIITLLHLKGEEAYHADCFKCILCKKKIEDLVFTQTTKVRLAHTIFASDRRESGDQSVDQKFSQGIFCTTCHEQRKVDKQKRKEERQRLQSQKPSSPSGYVDKTLPSLPADYPVCATSLMLPKIHSILIYSYSI